MLVLSRKCGERIVLPDLSVTVTIVAIKGTTVRLGIAAPAEVAVRREELARGRKSGSAAGDKPPNPTAAVHFSERVER